MKGGVMRRIRAERLLFVVSLISLLALVAWWTVLMSRSLEQNYAYRVAELSAVASDATHPERVALAAWYERRRLMVYGEGGLLVILTAICCFMLVRLAAEQRRYRQQLEAFVGQATHEMKTPLAGLRALLQTIELGRMPEEQLGDAVRLGLDQIARQERLIQNLLMGHRIRFAQGDFTCRATPVKPLIERLLRERSGAGARGCQFELVEPAQATALADAEALQTILENLFENSVLYGASQVEVSVVREAAQLLIHVRDNGDGFGPARRDELFEPYTRGSTAARGTGLGLPLSRSLAEAMGGRLDGVSEGEGLGATFTVSLSAATGEGA